MENKQKAQQMQSINTKNPSIYSSPSEYQAPNHHSMVFQHYPQYQNLSSNYAQINMTTNQKFDNIQNPSQGGRSQIDYGNESIYSSEKRSLNPGGYVQNYQYQSPDNVHSSHSHYSPRDEYEGKQYYPVNHPKERIFYQQSVSRINSTSHAHSSSHLQQQYQQIQQAKLQQQLKVQNDALLHQQRTFALRQQLNPPIGQSHYHLQHSLTQDSMQSKSTLSQQSRVPPTSLHLTNQFQPAGAPFNNDTHNMQMGNQRYEDNLFINKQKMLQNFAMQQQHKNNQQNYIQNSIQNRSKQQNHQPQPQENSNQIIIHQNHPNLVVNQACQTQMSSDSDKKTSPENMTSPQTPSHPIVEKKKSGNQMHTLKSPITKRPVTATVTLSGWLYKQGSDGLKVWRKRWFVLSDYILYYYKSSEEEKLLGSILLPSYKVSICSPDDKIYKKFAFKCEHLNMRTYWLAAESQECMEQWIKVLTAATMMQRSCESDQTSQPSVSSLNQSCENSDSGIQTYQSQQSKLGLPGPLTPASDNGGGGGGSSSNGGGVQPLYANAPPKPKRVNDGGYSSPSSDIERCDLNYDSLRQSDRFGNSKASSLQRNEMNREQIYQSNHENNLKRLQNFKDEVNEKVYDDNYNSQAIYMHQSAQQQQPYHAQYQQNIQNQQQMKLSESNNLIGSYTNPERRTPDAYGRSRLIHQQYQQQQMQQQQQQQQQQQLQQQMKSQMPQGNYFSDYEDIYNVKQIPNRNDVDNNALWSYKRPMSPMGYESELNHMQNLSYGGVMPPGIEPNMQQHIKMRPRSVKSAQVPRPHSADFLEYEARNMDRAYGKTDVTGPVQRPKSSLDINRSLDNFYYSEANYAEKMRESALLLQKYPHLTPEKTNSDYFHSLQKNIPANSSVTENSFNTVPNIHHKQTELHYKRDGNFLKEKSLSNDRFLRSASARFTRKDENGEIDGEKKREESMKRLLDWKQRMLQSPLTRKGVASKLTASSAINTAPVQNLQKPRTKPPKETPNERNDNSGYNSYSSDDEASISVRNFRNALNTNDTDSSSQFKIYNSSKINSPPSSYYDSTQRSNDKQSSAFYNIISNYGESLQGNNTNQKNSILDFENGKNLLKNLDVSAGDLLSRTHEELVLLLIQLRRQNSNTARAIEQTCTEIHNIQNSIRNCEGNTKIEQITKLENTKQHLFELEQQYEKSKPLVNLVDNMVKLGSLYRSGSRSLNQSNQSFESLDRLEFNHRMQEKRLLQEEKERWNRLSPNHLELKSKVQQLYQLDQLLLEESGTLQTLQRDKEDIERALGGLRARLKYGEDTPIALEAAKRHQYALEKELSRVHELLAENSKKLEQTVAGNARLEQELLILRQKLQASRLSKPSTYESQDDFTSETPTPSVSYSANSTTVLEMELRRVQKLVSDMQRQRQELGEAVRHLTDNSNLLYNQIKNDPKNTSKKSNSTGWQETNLDSLQSVKHITSPTNEKYLTENEQKSPELNKYMEKTHSTSSLYGGDDLESSNLNSYNDFGSNCTNLSTATENDSKYLKYDIKGTNGNQNRNTMKNNSHEIEGVIDSSEIESDYFLDEINAGNADKQEIKTVRIVKREHQQRQRDREKASISFAAQNLDQSYDRDLDYPNTNGLLNYSNSKEFSNSYLPQETTYQLKNNKQNLNDTPQISENSIKYSDYYNNLVNQYPISMTDGDQNKYKSLISPKEQNGHEKSYYNENIGLRSKTESVQSLTKVVPDLSPIFQSEAAKQILNEIGSNTNDMVKETVVSANKQRRAVPKEKRRHNTAPHYLNAKWMQSMQMENDVNSNGTSWRARDDLDMEVALRPRINTPDVVRSAIGPKENISENTIDKMLAAPSKILIPERYIPEQIPELTPEEKKKRQEKVEAIKKMLSEAPINSSNDTSTMPSSNTINAEKKQREHLLQLNQLLAQQVMQMSKIVAGTRSKE